MMHKPKLLLLDEPTAGVDPTARRDFWDELHKLAAEGISVLVSTHYMDEAERCHKLAYISYGKLLASGTAKEIIAGQKIYTVAVFGDNLISLANQLKELPEIEQTVVFGSSLHVSSVNEEMLYNTVKKMAKNCRVEPIETSLEDVFIYMMNNSQDNFGAPHVQNVQK